MLPFHDLLAFHVTTHRSLVQVQRQVEHLAAERTVIAAVGPQHGPLLAELSRLYADLTRHRGASASAAEALAKSCAGIDAWHEQHAAALQAVRGRHLVALRERLAVVTAESGVFLEVSHRCLIIITIIIIIIVMFFFFFFFFFFFLCRCPPPPRGHV